VTKREVPAHRRVELTNIDGRLTARWPVRRLRFLFDNGDTVDVLTEHDDSDLRGVMLEWSGADRIEGVADITAPPDEVDQSKLL
jgi:hypothetical protein